jgi:PEP-CTERM motif
MWVFKMVSCVSEANFGRGDIEMKKTTALLAGLVAAAGIAQANTVEATFNDVNPGGTMVVSEDGGVTTSDAAGGVFNWTRTGGDFAGPGLSGDFMTVCIETAENVAFGNNYTYQVVNLEEAPSTQNPGMGAAKADLLRELFGRYFSDSMTVDEAVMFQAATWEIVNDDGLDIDGDGFQVGVGAGVTIAMQGQVQVMLDSLDGTGPTVQLMAIVGDGIQDQVFVVPAPGSLALLGLGAFGLRRRRG